MKIAPVLLPSLITIALKPTEVGLNHHKSDHIFTGPSMMKLYHIGFVVFFIMMLFFPKIPISFLSFLPEKSSLGLGIFGLFLWLILVYKNCFHISVFPSGVKILCCFAIYTFLISIASMKISSIAYASQLLIYCFLGGLLLCNYMQRIMDFGQLSTLSTILITFGLIYSIGVVISVWTGPIYPHQVLWYHRNCPGFNVTRGTGFSEGPNMAGAILSVFSALLLFGLKQKWSIVVKVVVIVGLALTVSRAAIIGLIIGIFVIWLIDFLRYLLAGKFKLKSLIKLLCIPFFIGCLYFLSSYVLSPDSTIKSVAECFGIGGDGFSKRLTSNRSEFWQQGIESLNDCHFLTKLFGSGFHGSSTTTSYGTWLTSHNFYISLFGDFGLFGMVIFVIVFYKYFCVIFKRLIIIEGYGYERGTFVAIISLLAINMTETYFYSPVLISILIFLFAIQKAALKFHSYNKS